MPRLNVIVLDNIIPNSFRYVLWADVPVGRQPFYASTSKTSLWKDALSADNTNLQNGSVAEKVDYIWTTTMTVAQAEAELQVRWNAYQTAVNAKNDWTFYGTQWTGTAWSTQGAP